MPPAILGVTQPPTPLPNKGSVLWFRDAAIFQGQPDNFHPFLVLNEPEVEGQRFLVVGTSQVGRTAHRSRSFVVEPADCPGLTRTTIFQVDSVYQFAEREIRSRLERRDCHVRGLVSPEKLQSVLNMVKDSKIVEPGIKRALGLLV